MCRDHVEQGRVLYDADAHRAHGSLFGGHDPGVCARNHGSCCLWLLGYPEQAVEWARESRALAEQLAHPLTRITALAFASFLHHFRREPQLTEEFAEATMAVCVEQDLAPHFRATGGVMHGWAVAAQGRAEEGLEAMRQGLDALRAMRLEVRRSYFLTMLAEAYADVGRLDEGLAALAEAQEVIERTHEPRWEDEVHRLQGVLLLDRSARDRDASEACFKKAIEIARRQSARSLELRAATSLARLWAAAGKRAAAHDLLAPIYGWFTEGFDTNDLKDAKTLLDRLT